MNYLQKKYYYICYRVFGLIPQDGSAGEYIKKERKKMEEKNYINFLSMKIYYDNPEQTK